MARRGLSVLVVTLLTAVSAPVHARETAPMASANEAQAALAGAQTDLEAALTPATADCSAACVALASMRRAAERLCALEPGPRCDAARKRLEAARQRVAERCPTCEALREFGQAQQPAADPGDDPVDVVEDDDLPKPKAGGPAKKPEDGDAKPAVLTVETADTANAPPGEESTGGCAACHLGGADDPRGLWALALAALALGLRRR